MTRDERRQWVKDLASEAGLSEKQTSLAVGAAMSADDSLSDEEFQDMVESVVEGVARDYSEDLLISIDRFRAFTLRVTSS